MNYLDFKSHKYLTLDAKVINHYKKRNYYVLKLKTKTLTFYTTSREDLKNLLNENIELTIVTKNVSFKDYLFTFYAPSFNIKLLPVTKAEEYIEKQHESKEISDIFKALFLGESVSYDTRQKLSALGVSHLIALSGLHLGFISLFLYLIISPIYRLFQRKFPYRNRFVDIAAVVFVIEFIYLYITSFPPSLVRAYLLEILLFLYAYYLQNPFSLKVLTTLILISLVFFEKVLSLGYFLSITGVFYIYLFFRYFKPTFLNSLILSFYMFAVMFVISHAFFGNFNLYQLLSPVVNILFSLFYPLEIIFHLLGYGGVFDEVLKGYLNLGSEYVGVKFPFWFMLLFLALSLVAFFKRWAFYGINLIAVLAIIYAIGVSVGKI
jgi:competence protein ComEC